MSGLLVLEGILLKLLTGADDTLAHTPLISTLTQSRKGKLAFLFGMFFSVILILILAILFAGVLINIPYRNIVSAALLVIIALMVHFDVFVHKPREKCCKYVKKEAKVKESHFMKLFGVGFFAFFATAIDDTIVYSSLLLKTFNEQLLVGAGILIAAVAELVLIFYFSKLINKIKYKSEITVIGLLVLAVLVGFGVL